MKASVVWIALGLFALQTFGQQKVRPDGFHWDSHNWQELSWKQSISRSHLPPSLRADLIETIVEQMREDQSSNEPLTEARTRSVAETRIEFVDLTGHGRNEVIAQAGGEGSDCSPTGNCPFWVLRHERDGYHVMLVGSAQTFTIQPNRTRGYNDLVLGMHGSAFESTLTVYKYKGSSYEDVACYNATWQVVGKSGNVHNLKEPRITPCGSR